MRVSLVPDHFRGAEYLWSHVPSEGRVSGGRVSGTVGYRGEGRVYPTATRVMATLAVVSVFFLVSDFSHWG